ncbi:hypothetical protein ATY78_08850 [Rhizobium sp. R635]|nr:hypothetical protein ATY78_08850 [Rhizobium sp. R635]
MLSELISNIIPNQRIDRIERYLEGLGRRLEAATSADHLRSLIVDPTNIALVEDGAIQATRALSPERIEQITACVVQGVLSESTSTLLKRRVLGALGDLDDQHLAILKAYATPGFHAVATLRPQSKATLGRPPTLLEQEADGLWHSAIGKLEQMALLDFIPKLKAVDNRYPVPQYDSRGKPEGTYRPTVFGLALLVAAGLATER